MPTPPNSPTPTSPPAQAASPSPDLLALAGKLYRRGPRLLRTLQHHRPRICPFGPVMDLVPRGSRVLDVGCGGGLLLALLYATGRLHPTQASVGFDSSGVAIDLAQMMAADLDTTLPHRSPGPRPAVPRFLHLPVQAEWPEGRFDVVSIVDVIHHVPPADQRSVFDLAVAHLNPGGLLLYKDMADRPLWRAWANRLHDLTLARQWIHYLPIERAERWATELGLVFAAGGAADMLWYAHQWRVWRKPA
ncbi:MAG: class I SAM-dependent methyltransferase [Planctomycetaceae bacterium]|nr:class I SAM-dependent methyltransferase [Planctomycetaceae bacterium]